MENRLKEFYDYYNSGDEWKRTEGCMNFLYDMAVHTGSNEVMLIHEEFVKITNERYRFAKQLKEIEDANT